MLPVRHHAQDVIDREIASCYERGIGDYIAREERGKDLVDGQEGKAMEIEAIETLFSPCILEKWGRPATERRLCTKYKAIPGKSAPG